MARGGSGVQAGIVPALPETTALAMALPLSASVAEALPPSAYVAEALPPPTSMAEALPPSAYVAAVLPPPASVLSTPIPKFVTPPANLVLQQAGSCSVTSLPSPDSFDAHVVRR
jgi:hypothetical protein